MGFYQQISRYYDDIFPLSAATEAFYTGLFNKHAVRSVLDVACGSGSYVKAFLDRGLDAYGIDLDPAMVEKARAKTAPNRIHAGDMALAAEAFSTRFDALLCIGNSIVHLQNEEGILKAVQGFHQLLRPAGILSIQIVNYDRILDQRLEGLPVIQKAETGLTFERRYGYDTESGLIHFHTTLQVPDGTFENSIPLYPLRRHALERLLEKAGFRETLFFGDFQGAPWKPESYATIVTAHSV